MANLNFRTAYQKHKRYPIMFEQPTLTKQAFKDECDINNIMSKYQKTGMVEHLNQNNGEYGDFISYEDYHTSLNQILEAQETFNSIPSSIREKFNNNPAEFLEFAQNPDNHNQMVQFGMAHPKPPIDAEPKAKEESYKTDPPSDGPRAEKTTEKETPSASSSKST